MKKIALILTLLLLFSGFSLAEGIDILNLSDEELTGLQQRVANELYNRGIDRQNLIYYGTYVVGKDIKAGTYIVSSVNNGRFHYCLFDSLDDYDVFMKYKEKFAYSMVLPNYSIDAGGSGRMELKDGNVLYALYEGEQARLESQSADWMP